MHAMQSISEVDGEPLEWLNAVPESVRKFAGELASARRLVHALEIPFVAEGLTGVKLRNDADLKPISEVRGVGDWLDWSQYWLAHFARINQAAALNLRLSHSRRPTCPRFHVDGVRMRLITTLTGPGTQWLRSRDVERCGDGSISQTPHPNHIQQLAQGSLGMFKGSGFDAGADTGVVHRSPPDCVDRVVMVVDLAA